MSDEEYEVESILQKRVKKGKVIALHYYFLITMEPVGSTFILVLIRNSEPKKVAIL